MAKDKKIRPLKWLLLIPIQVIIDALVMWGATYLDSVIYSDAANMQGHPAPAFTLIAFMLFGLITIVVFIVAIIMFIVSCVRKASQKKDSE